MAQSIFHPANTRGLVDLGWLKSYHSFSFGSYYNPERLHFGALRVLNDDVLNGGEGFGDHPHDNMEIISIPLQGGLKHVDSMHNVAVIGDGDIQVMSAGTGIFHQEHNDDQDEAAQFLQIWVYPNRLNVEPRYDQLTLDKTKRHNQLQKILSPSKDDDGVWIYQDAWFNLGSFDKGRQVNYPLKAQANGVYVFVIAGSVSINGQALTTRDGMGIWDTDAIAIDFAEDSEILLMEVPMLSVVDAPKKKQILVVGKHPEIMKVIVRLINSKPNLNGTVAISAIEAIDKSTTTAFDAVLLGAGLTDTEAQQLRAHFTVPIVQHYGGGSGLLFAEIYGAVGR